MPDPSDLDEESMRYAAEISEALQHSQLTVSAAESLTSGAIACHLGAAGAASEWFAGGVVAYSKKVKFDVLGVSPGPVVTESCARQMATGVAALTGSDYAVAVTGVGGPEPEEDQPVGTVFIAVRTPDGDTAEGHRFDGDPEEVLRSTIRAALRLLCTQLQASVDTVRKPDTGAPMEQ
jgi:nicotinamide-nucleotide amidase